MTVTGDICNNGRSKVYDTSISANGKTYYVGYLDPSDFDSFEIVIPANVSKVQLKATWTNEIGERFEKVIVVKVSKVEEVKKGGNEIFPLAISLITLVVILIVVVIAWKKGRR